MNRICGISGIAYCEGDDYRTDPLKLEKQVCFLEDNPGLVACFGSYTRYNEVSRESSNSRIEPTDKKDENGFAFNLKDMQSQWLTKTLTAFVRKSAIKEIDPSAYRHYRDIHFSYHLIKGRQTYFLFDNMGYTASESPCHSCWIITSGFNRINYLKQKLQQQKVLIQV